MLHLSLSVLSRRCTNIRFWVIEPIKKEIDAFLGWHKVRAKSVNVKVPFMMYWACCYHLPGTVRAWGNEVHLPIFETWSWCCCLISKIPFWTFQNIGKSVEILVPFSLLQQCTSCIFWKSDINIIFNAITVFTCSSIALFYGFVWICMYSCSFH